MANAYVSLGEPHSGRPATMLMQVTDEGGRQTTQEISVATARVLAKELQLALSTVDRKTGDNR